MRSAKFGREQIQINHHHLQNGLFQDQDLSILTVCFGFSVMRQKRTDCHKVKATSVPNIVTPIYLNLSSIAQEISKFEKGSCTDISFLQLPSHIKNRA